jgi:hypothetical protein
MISRVMTINSNRFAGDDDPGLYDGFNNTTLNIVEDDITI